MPLEVAGLIVGGRPVLVGLLPESSDPTEINGAMRRYRNQAVIARSWLTPDETVDLHLFLASPVGAQGELAWRQAALAIERDERVCRKLVWLRPSTEGQEAASFSAFARGYPDRHRCGFGVFAIMPFRDPNDKRSGAGTDEHSVGERPHAVAMQ